MSKVSPLPSILNSRQTHLFSDGSGRESLSQRPSYGILPQFNNEKKDVADRKRKQKAVKLTLLLVLPMLVLLTMTIMAHINAVQHQQNANSVIATISTSLEVAELVRMLQIEHGHTSMFLSSNRSQEVYDRLINDRRETDDKHNKVSDWSFVNIPELHTSTPKSRGPYFAIFLGAFRANADMGFVTVRESIQFFSNLNHGLIGSLFSNVRAPQQSNYLVAFDNFARACEYAAIERGIGAAFWIPCDYTENNKLWLIEVHSNHEQMFKAAFRYSKDLQIEYYRLRDTVNYPLWPDIEQMVSHLTSDSFRHNCSLMGKADRLQMGHDWFNNMTFYINMLSDVRKVLMVTLENSLEDYTHDAQTKVIIYSFVLLLVTVCTVATIYTVTSIFTMTAKLQEFATSITKKTKEIEKERRRTDEVLSQILPKTVAEALKRNETVEAEFFNDVTIYFSDIVGFTSISAQSSPHQVINLLNMLYSMFDSTIDKYDVYKVETIGDAYMVASGLPIRNGDRHAAEIALLSLDLLRNLQGATVPHIPEQHIMLRIGLHTGPCAAGVVGVKMPRYCLFGDTINTASRMESTGEAMKIHLSETTRDRLSQKKGFRLEYRGKTGIKGKGTMMTHWLTGYDEPNFIEVPLHIKHGE